VKCVCGIDTTLLNCVAAAAVARPSRCRASRHRSSTTDAPRPGDSRVGVLVAAAVAAGGYFLWLRDTAALSSAPTVATVATATTTAARPGDRCAACGGCPPSRCQPKSPTEPAENAPPLATTTVRQRPRSFIRHDLPARRGQQRRRRRWAPVARFETQPTYLPWIV
jgi:hypothetical protein